MTRLVHIVGTDTGVGKSHLLAGLTAAGRAGGARVWVHKPVACGGWDAASNTAEDGRAVAALVGDGQDPRSACPVQLPLPLSPHLAARAAGVAAPMAAMQQRLRNLLTRAQENAIDWLLVEGAGGLCSPLSTDEGDQRDLVSAIPGAVLLVTRPDLGTINHTTLTATVLEHLGQPAAGLVINHCRAPDHAADPALATARHALPAASGVALWAELAFGATDCRSILPRLAQLPTKVTQ